LRYHLALKALNQWVNANPTSGEALEWRGLALETLWYFLDAQNSYEQAVAVAPHRRTARFHLVELLLLNKANPDDITKHLQVLLQEEPGRPEYLVAQARLKDLTGDFPAARECFQQALQLTPNDAAIMAYLAEMEYKAGQFCTAEFWARKAIANGSRGFKPYLVLAESLKRQKAPDKAKEVDVAHQKYLALKSDADHLNELLRGATEQHKDDPDVLAEIAGIFLRDGQDKAGLYWAHKALQRDPYHAPSHALLAAYHKQHGDTEAAAKHQALAKAAAPK
jgi:tetratricopeptide (TPR) repeat protein